MAVIIPNTVMAILVFSSVTITIFFTALFIFIVVHYNSVKVAIENIGDVNKNLKETITIIQQLFKDKKQNQ